MDSHVLWFGEALDDGPVGFYPEHGVGQEVWVGEGRGVEDDLSHLLGHQPKHNPGLGSLHLLCQGRQKLQHK